VAFFRFSEEYGHPRISSLFHVTGIAMITQSSLISRQNLKLAWLRISTARNLQHKRFFRHLYGA
jgi:hypothetical protein